MSIQKKEYKSKRTGKTVRKYYACVYDTRSEKPVWSSGFSTEREAKREEARMIREQEKHSIAEGKVPFSEAAEEFLAGSKARYAKSTYKTYVAYYKRYIKPVFGDKEIHTIKPRHVQLFFNEICEKYAPATANKIKNLMSLVSSMPKTSWNAMSAILVPRSEVPAFPNHFMRHGPKNRFLTF